LKVDGGGRKKGRRGRGEEEQENKRQPASDAEVETARLRKERCVDLPEATSFIYLGMKQLILDWVLNHIRATNEVPSFERRLHAFEC
jgi:hypothetical protein